MKGYKPICYLVSASRGTKQHKKDVPPALKMVSQLIKTLGIRLENETQATGTFREKWSWRRVGNEDG